MADSSSSSALRVWAISMLIIQIVWGFLDPLVLNALSLYPSYSARNQSMKTEYDLPIHPFDPINFLIMILFQLVLVLFLINVIKENSRALMIYLITSMIYFIFLIVFQDRYILGHVLSQFVNRDFFVSRYWFNLELVAISFIAIISYLYELNDFTIEVTSHQQRQQQAPSPPCVPVSAPLNPPQVPVINRETCQQLGPTAPYFLEGGVQY